MLGRSDLGLDACADRNLRLRRWRNASIRMPLQVLLCVRLVAVST